MKVFASLTLNKPLGEDVFGSLDLSFTPNTQRSYIIGVFEKDLCIQGNGLDMQFSHIPNRLELNNPQERAMIAIFCEVVFGPLQAMYEKTQPIWVDTYMAANELTTKPIYKTELKKVLERTSEADILELKELMGRFPTENEIVYIESETKPVPHERFEY